MTETFLTSTLENPRTIVAKESRTKTGIVAASSFTGSPKKFTVVLDSPFPNNNYTVEITGGDCRSWTYETVTLNGFIINANASRDLSASVSWIATHTGV